MKNVRTRIYFKLVIIEIIVVVAMRFLIPLLSDYPPYSEDPLFQSKIETLSHNQQYLMLGIFAIALQLFFTTFFFNNIFKYLKKDKSKVTVEETERVRKDCFKIPNKLLIAQTLLLAFVLCLLFTMVKISIVLCIKFLLIYFSFFTASWVLSMALVNDDLNEIIESTYTINKNFTIPKKKTKFYITLIRNLIPFFIFIMITVSLLGYAKVSDQVGESKYTYYKQYFANKDLNSLSYSDLNEFLSSVELREPNDYYFIITDEAKYFSNPNGSVTSFFVEYANSFINETDGRIYEYYGIEEQAYGQKIVLMDGTSALVGFKFSTMSVSTIYFFLVTAVFSTIIYVIILTIWTKNISKTITSISNKLAMIAKHSDIERDYILPLFSNDEIGALTISFSEIQKTTKSNIRQIKDNQEVLMEKERLATLGQMIGGVAHNLKTPIMSISGATEGLEDLVKEYEDSAGDPDVTIDDHHAIAHDMRDWIGKIRSYDSYMSDIITAVKGQAVSMSENEDDSFTLEEMLSRVTILMKHELKEALVTMNVDSKIPQNTKINGNVNALVQVVNNLISNAIQAYGVVQILGKSYAKAQSDTPAPAAIGDIQNVSVNEKTIDLIIDKKDDNIVISVEDHGCGMSDEVKNKLFKEMITTKGHNGSGLGLFMSYSTIKGNFKGDIKFTSEVGKGTTFNIILPRK